MRKHKWLVVIPLLLVFLAIGVWALGGRDKTKTTGELLVDLHSREEKDRIVAVRTLPVKPDDAGVVVPALIEALKDKQPDIRLSAAIKLGSFGELAKEAVPALQAALRDRDARVRGAAINAITRIDPSAAAKAGSSKREEP